MKLATRNITLTPAVVPPPPPACKTDADCPPGYVCINGVCVPEKEKKFPWGWIAIGGAGLAALVLLAPENKKRGT